MKTYAPKPRDIERRWYVIDANDAVLGRVATEVASILKGKHKPIYAPHADTGDHVIVINAGGIRLTGGKELKKVAYRHSGHPGGLTETRYDRIMAERPVFAVEKAVKGMLPKNSLGRSMLRKLQVYEGAEHPHAAQKPESLALGQIPRWNGLPQPAAKPAEEKTAAKKPAGTESSAPVEKATTATTTTTKRPAAAKKTTGDTTKSSAAAKKSTAAAKKSTGKPVAKKSAAAKKTVTKKSPPKDKGEDA